MKISDAGLDLIKSQEGLVLHPYLDVASVPTIGYGTTHYPNGRAVTMKDEPITPAQATGFLSNDVTGAEDAVTADVKSEINQNQFDALVDFAYNVGIGALKGSTLLRRVNANPSDPLIRDAFMLWNKAHVDGSLVVVDDLTHRRKKEADLYFS